MNENEKQLQKLRIIVADYQQKLANADLATADARAELQLAQAELALKDERIVELQEASAAGKTPTAAKGT